MTSVLSPAIETVKTVKTTVEIELQRTETLTQIRCTQCARTGEVRKVEFTPPASIGGSVASCRVPEGWWVQGATYFGIKGTCPECFEKPFAAVVRSNDGSRARSVESGEDAAREKPLVPWQAMLSTPGGASAVTKALAIHLRQTIAARGPGESAESIRGTSLPRIVEILEAASARLEEFRPKDAADVDLTSLGEWPFAVPFERRQSIIDEDSPEPCQDSSNSAAALDLLERIERVCASGGKVFVSGVSRRDRMGMHANVTMSNAKNVELSATAEGDTAAHALRSALGKVYL